jgi:RNA polymerase alpha subunit
MRNKEITKEDFGKDLELITKYDDHFREYSPSNESVNIHEKMLKKSVATLWDKYTDVLLDTEDRKNLMILVKSYGAGYRSRNEANVNFPMLDMDLSIRAYNRLSALTGLSPKDIALGHIIKYNKRDMMKADGIGRRTFIEIKERVKDLGRWIKE